MAKSAEAFRTISEVAEWLETPAHVLRFWESKFAQVKPVKRAGGRRYYRPADMELLGGIKRLLHEEGMTIKGVQKLLRERGVAHVASLSPKVIAPGEESAPDLDESAPFIDAADEPPQAKEEPTVVPFRHSAAEEEAAEVLADHATDEAPGPETGAPQAEPDWSDTPSGAPKETEVASTAAPEEHPESTAAAGEEPAPEPSDEPELPATQDPLPGGPPVTPAEARSDGPPPMPADTDLGAPTPPVESESEPAPAGETATVAEMPRDDAERHDAEADATAAEDQRKPRPRIAEVPPDPADDEIAAQQGLLSAISTRTSPLTRGQAAEIAPLLQRLADWARSGQAL